MSDIPDREVGALARLKCAAIFVKAERERRFARRASKAFFGS